MAASLAGGAQSFFSLDFIQLANALQKRIVRYYVKKQQVMDAMGLTEGRFPWCEPVASAFEDANPQSSVQA